MKSPVTAALALKAADADVAEKLKLVEAAKSALSKSKWARDVAHRTLAKEAGDFFPMRNEDWTVCLPNPPGEGFVLLRLKDGDYSVDILSPTGRTLFDNHYVQEVTVTTPEGDAFERLKKEISESQCVEPGYESPGILANILNRHWNDLPLLQASWQSRWLWREFSRLQRAVYRAAIYLGSQHVTMAGLVVANWGLGCTCETKSSACMCFAEEQFWQKRESVAKRLLKRLSHSEFHNWNKTIALRNILEDALLGLDELDQEDHILRLWFGPWATVGRRQKLCDALELEAKGLNTYRVTPGAFDHALMILGDLPLGRRDSSGF